MKFNTQLITLFIGVCILSISCVSKKSFDALQAEKDELAMKLDKLQADFDSSKSSQEAEIAALKDANTNLSSQKTALNADLEKAKSDFDMKLAKVQESVDDKQSQLDNLRGEINAAFADVENAVAGSNARINEIENFLYLDLNDELDFRSGSARVDPNDKETLQMLANMLTGNPNVAMIIEGHTDSKQILDGKQYKDNWDLSVSRATAVVRKLIDMGVNPDQLIASGRAEFMPTGDNTTAEGRAENRRTEAILVPNIGKLYRVTKGN